MIFRNFEKIKGKYLEEKESEGVFRFSMIRIIFINYFSKSSEFSRLRNFFE